MPDLQKIAVSYAVFSAEIKWSLKSCLCLDLNTLFNDIFSDSEVAKKFQQSKTKIGYYITFGIAPYFGSLLQDIRSSPFFSVMFDESLNKIFQEEQMDAQIRYWKNALSLACTIYFDSQNMLRLNANNLAEELENSLINLNIARMIHLSKDGPNTNWAVIEKIQQNCQMKERAFLNLQTCGLYTMSGALQTEITSSNWNIEKAFFFDFLSVT